MPDDPFGQMIVFDYYDGPAGGLLQCNICGAEYHFYLLGWNEMHSVRIFALAPLPKSSFEDIFCIFDAVPDRRVWIPPWPSDERRLDLYEISIQCVIGRAGTPTGVIGWSVGTERTLAMRAVDSSLTPHLMPWFDRPLHADWFDWFSYLGLMETQQV